MVTFNPCCSTTLSIISNFSYFDLYDATFSLNTNLPNKNAVDAPAPAPIITIRVAKKTPPH